MLTKEEKVEFLGVEWCGSIEQRGSSKTTLVKQMSMGDQDTKIKVSEIGKSIVEGIRKISGSTEVSALVTLPGKVKGIDKDRTVQISEVYLKVVRETGKPTDVEYALGLRIKLTEEERKKLNDKPPFNVVQIEELFLKIWKTDNPAILDEMNIIDFDLLPAPASSKKITG